MSGLRESARILAFNTVSRTELEIAKLRTENAQLLQANQELVRMRGQLIEDLHGLALHHRLERNLRLSYQRALQPPPATCEPSSFLRKLGTRVMGR